MSISVAVEGAVAAVAHSPRGDDRETRDEPRIEALPPARLGGGQRALDAGVAREVARIVLPLNTYSSMYVTMNARSLMNFLSLRTKVEGSHFPSFPQREIEMCAEKMEDLWATLMPMTHSAFAANGRVAP